MPTPPHSPQQRVHSPTLLMSLLLYLQQPCRGRGRAPPCSFGWLCTPAGWLFEYLWGNFRESTYPGAQSLIRCMISKGFLLLFCFCFCFALCGFHFCFVLVQTQKKIPLEFWFAYFFHSVACASKPFCITVARLQVSHLVQGPGEVPGNQGGRALMWDAVRPHSQVPQMQN